MMEAGAERLFRAIGGVGGDLVDLAERRRYPASFWKRLAPLAACFAIVLVLQNGICVDELLAAAGENRSACGVTSFSSTMISPTHMKITGEGAFQIGMAAGNYDVRLDALREALSSMVPTTVETPILPYMYSKLIINSGITCGGALTGQLLGAMLRSSQAREFFIGLVYEDMALAEKMGIKVPPFGGRLD